MSEYGYGFFGALIGAGLYLLWNISDELYKINKKLDKLDSIDDEMTKIRIG